MSNFSLVFFGKFKKIKDILKLTNLYDEKKLQKTIGGFIVSPPKMPSGNFSEEGCVNPKLKISANEIEKRMKSIIKGKCFD